MRQNPTLAILGNPPPARRGGRELARSVYGITYRHADDGQDYRHDFGRGVGATLNRDGSVTLRHAEGKSLWKDFSERPYLINPREEKRAMAKQRGRARRAKRPPPKGFRSWKDYMASIRPPHTSGGKMAKRKGRSRGKRAGSRVVMVNPPKARRGGRRFRRNPPLVEQIGDVAMSGLRLGLEMTTGKAASRYLPTLVGLPNTGPLGWGVQLLTGLALGVATNMLLPRGGTGAALFAGAVSGVAESAIKQYNVPILAPALGDASDYARVLEAQALLQGYPQQFLSGYPSSDGRTAGLPAAMMMQ